ncbi:A disintegrin and metalloproteinase with thrombospondin motifs 8 [Gastrophryne carolinensis]
MALTYLWLMLVGCCALPRGQVTVPRVTPGVGNQVTLRLTPPGGQEVAIQLLPDATFLVPGLRIRNVGKRGAEEEDPGSAVPRSCFYSSREPLAAFSLCRGVRGAFILRGRDSYVIQPLTTGGSIRDPHIIYRATRGEDPRADNLQTCGIECERRKRQTAERQQKRQTAERQQKRQPLTTGGSIRDPHIIYRATRGEDPRADNLPTCGIECERRKRQLERPGSHTIERPQETSQSDTIKRQPPGWRYGESRAGELSSIQGRHRRFVSSERFVEILLVADTSMVRFYGEDLKLHLLTLMSVASGIFRHPSLRNAVSLVLVKVLLLDDGDAAPDVSDNGGLTLRNFCRWQQAYNPPSDRHPEHYDTAILLTRQDFCGHESCDTLGVADIGTVCDPAKSCSVIEDDGLQAAYTLAHELAHVLSIPHDNSNNCKKVFGEGTGHHLMVPLFLQLNRSAPWSPCSATHLTEFLDSGHGDCLLDAPGLSLQLPRDLPGTSPRYDLDSQCRQVFGEDFGHCPGARPEEACAQLWCKIPEEPVCHTKNGSLPWADGTPCGGGRMCWEGVCLEEDKVMEPREPVDGNWGSWGPWGDCSRSCGGGVRFSYRECDDPEPQNGGKYCQGQRAIYQSCNTQECPLEEKSFREVQCEQYNAYNYTDRNGHLIQWIPKYSGVSPRDRCKLMCRARSGSEFKVFQNKVVDGTLCGPESLAVCVQGRCVKAGCDHELHSTKKLDKCSVCGGDGSDCRKISGSLSKARFGYTDVVTVPAGATNLDVKQRSHRGIIYDGMYLALRRADGTYLLNGDYAVSAMEQDLHLRGTVLLYSGSNASLERIQSFQPLPEVLTVQLLRVSAEAAPPKLKYTFFIPKTSPYGKPGARDKPSHHLLRPLLTSRWVLGDWSSCSKSCGSGWKRRTVECRDVAGGPSDQCPQELRPEDIRACGDVPCPVWRAGSWSPCSRSCGGGIRTRRVYCMDYAGQETEEDKCDPEKRSAAPPASCVLEEC